MEGLGHFQVEWVTDLNVSLIDERRIWPKGKSKYPNRGHSDRAAVMSSYATHFIRDCGVSETRNPNPSNSHLLRPVHTY
jgi:hypothetical protein